jgi:hypothetical protein
MSWLSPLFGWGTAPDENVGAKIGAVRPYYRAAFDADLSEQRRILSDFFEYRSDQKPRYVSLDDRTVGEAQL